MGNSDNSPNDGKLSLDTSAPLWSAILTEISKGMPIAKFKQPRGLKTATVDAFTGLKPGPFTRKTVKEIFLPETVPTQKATSRIVAQIDEASGLLWQDGCVGPKVTKGFFDICEVDAAFPTWQKADRNWAARAARGAGVRGTRRAPGRRTSTTAASPRSGGRGARRSRRPRSARSRRRAAARLRSRCSIRRARACRRSRRRARRPRTRRRREPG